jgi:threonine dehydrogenase-like Zn-dependent dehydrogenase
VGGHEGVGVVVKLGAGTGDDGKVKLGDRMFLPLSPPTPPHSQREFGF